MKFESTQKPDSAYTSSVINSIGTAERFNSSSKVAQQPMQSNNKIAIELLDAS